LAASCLGAKRAEPRGSPITGGRGETRLTGGWSRFA
jgi:hypothetical protein